ncbi:protein FAM53C [Takifugu rubripes]|nr:protein FAM53C-like [Takifugu rubripes]
MVGLEDATRHPGITELSSGCSGSPPPVLNGCRWLVTTVMVTLITEQLRKQSLEEPYDKALNVTVSLPAVGSSPTVSWSACRSAPDSSYPSFKPALLEGSGGPDSPWPASRPGKPVQRPDFSVAEKAFQSSPPPPPPPKRHCRSLSVPEDLSRCRSMWHPTASKIWTPVRRDCRSGEVSTSSSAASSLPVGGAGSSFASFASSLRSSSSPTFFSLALTSDSPLPWSFQWDPCQALAGAGSASIATPSSCSSSPAPPLQRRFSLSPVHIQDTAAVLRSPRPSPAAASAHGCCGGMEHPALSPSPTSACSTPSSCRRGLQPALPRCRSQPCDMRRPRLKRRHDPDVLPCHRPGLDFSKMTQMGNRGSPVYSSGAGGVLASPQLEQGPAFSPTELLGRASIGPLSESEEEEDEDHKRETPAAGAGQKFVFERDCTELDLNLIEEN